jgi:selenocysteine lyase/cysteine desulfurase
VGALVFRDQTMLAQLKLAEVRTGRHSTPDLHSLARRRVAALERGGLAPGLLGAVPATVDFLAGLDEDATGDRRSKLATSLPAAEEYMNGLARHLIDGLRDFGVVHVVGVTGDDHGAYNGGGHGSWTVDDGGYTDLWSPTDRVPRVSFLVPGLSAATVAERLLDNGVVAEVVGLEDSALFDQMGVAEMGGAVCVAFAPHNTRYDVDQLVRVVGGMV